MHQEEGKLYNGLGYTEWEEGKYFNQTFLIRRECTGFSAGRDRLGIGTELMFHSVIHCLQELRKQPVPSPRGTHLVQERNCPISGAESGAGSGGRNLLTETLTCSILLS